jgi:hypothetical protein
MRRPRPWSAADERAGWSSRAQRSLVRIPTPLAARYLGQLCKHFQHKCPVTLDGSGGRIGFGIGDCVLHAEPDMLLLSLAAADAEQLARLQDVVARHLLRFAFREPMRIDWQGT